MPGRTCNAPGNAAPAATGFNGGPGNCPAELVAGEAEVHVGEDASMEGRAIARPNRTTASKLLSPIRLQWRAGQLPGRTADCDACRAVFPRMLQWRAGQLPGRTSSLSRCGGLSAGRFNGGPGNCPAELARGEPDEGVVRVLQWRAGQLPGRTGWSCDTGLPDPTASMEGRAIARPNRNPATVQVLLTTASMEGRAIARPNHYWSGSRSGRSNGFNGGPGNCPAEPEDYILDMQGQALLQWRAGQLPGRTGGDHGRRSVERHGFNGGPGNCPAEPAG